MSNRTPAPVQISPGPQPGRVRIERKIAVITPVFGGGVFLEQDELKRQFKEPDRVTPLRGSAARGHLRFWWRATRGVALPNLANMRDREGEIWGEAASDAHGANRESRALPVRLRWRDVRITIEALPVFDMMQSKKSGRWNPRPRNGMREIAYGAFPLQPKGGQDHRLEPGVLHTYHRSAVLEIDAPAEFETDVEAALRAWLVFGGLGGRTRRGFGSLQAQDYEQPDHVHRELSLDHTNVRGVPYLAAGRMTIMPEMLDTPLEALQHALGRLQKFRQGPGFGRNFPVKDPENQKPAGRSRWPEANAIRYFSERSDLRHKPPTNGVWKFPRAAFGLPIIFHFESRDDPADHELRPVNRKRLASPLIIRAFRATNGYSALAVALRSTTDELPSLELNGPSGNRGVDGVLLQADAATIQPLDNATDPIDAFLRFFETRDLEERANG